MATGKRYYWIKLKDSFMSSDEIDYLMSQPDGANYVVLYQMLCLKTINTNGCFGFQNRRNAHSLRCRKDSEGMQMVPSVNRPSGSDCL